jgi:hypothetical protein
MSKIVEIIVFDDGNDEFKGYENRWTITKKMFNGGKVELTNVADQNIKIRSISSWKTRKILHLQYPE